MSGELELARLGVAVLGTGAATYYDLTNNRNVPDWLTVGMLGLGALAVLVSLGLEGALMVAVPAVVVLAVGYLLYRSGQIGGADVLLFAALALLIPEAPKGILGDRTYILSVPFVFSLFLASGILFGMVTFARFLMPSVRALQKGTVRLEVKQKLYVALMGAMAVIFAWFSWANGLPVGSTAVVLLAMFFSAFFYIFKSFIARKFLIKRVSVRGIEEEDVLAVEEMDPRVVEKYGLKRLLTRKEIERLGKLPLKQFPVYKNMFAFTPYILIALVLSILFGDLVLLLFLAP